MIFISDECWLSGVFCGGTIKTTVGDPMNKSGTLIASALLTFGIAAGAMAADTPAAASTPAASTSTGSSHSSSTSKHSHSSKHGHSSTKHGSKTKHSSKTKPTAAPTADK
jgi:hypothetical protein